MSGPDKCVLLLGGTEEAYLLAEEIERLSGWRCLTSLAGVTRNPKIPAGELIKGGFGGEAGIARFLADKNISALIDATHPFAERISESAVRACGETRTPILRLERAPWPVRPDWVRCPDVKKAAAFFRGKQARIFLTIGRREADEFRVSSTSYFLVRMIDPPPSPLQLDNHDLLLMRGPFTVEEERRIIRDHRIEWMVAKNSGGESGAAKLTAAEAEGVRVCMIDRPALPDCETAEAPGDALEWLARL